MIKCEHKKLINADALKQAVLALPNCDNGFSDTYDKSLIIGLIDEQIEIDAVTFVWCEDCCEDCKGREKK